MSQKQEIIGLISRVKENANLIIEEELKKRSIKGIVPAHGAVLYFLFAQKRPVPIKEVVQNVRRVKSTVTSILNTLVKYGFVEKSPCLEDSRVTNVILTSKGRDIEKEFFDISKILIEKVYANIPIESQDKLVNILDKIEQNLLT